MKWWWGQLTQSSASSSLTPTNFISSFTTSSISNLLFLQASCQPVQPQPTTPRSTLPSLDKSKPSLALSPKTSPTCSVPLMNSSLTLFILATPKKKLPQALPAPSCSVLLCQTRRRQSALNCRVHLYFQSSCDSCITLHSWHATPSITTVVLHLLSSHPLLWTVDPNYIKPCTFLIRSYKSSASLRKKEWKQSSDVTAFSKKAEDISEAKGNLSK